MHIQSILPEVAKLSSSFKFKIITGRKIPQIKKLLKKFKIDGYVKQYNPQTIYDELVDCDIGIVPQQVRPIVSMKTIASKTSNFYESEDLQFEDITRRCKVTSNAGRQFIFMQIGVPTVTDACPESILYSSFNGQPLTKLVSRYTYWSSAIESFIGDFHLRSTISKYSIAFANKFLTTKRQSEHIINEISKLKRPSI